MDVIGGGHELVREDAREGVLTQGKAVRVGRVTGRIELGGVGKGSLNTLRR